MISSTKRKVISSSCAPFPPLSSLHGSSYEPSQGRTLDALQHFLRIFPNLEYLSLEGWCDDALDSIALSRMSSFELGRDHRWLHLLDIVRESSVHCVVIRWSSDSKKGSVRFSREAGMTRSFTKERFSEI